MFDLRYNLQWICGCAATDDAGPLTPDRKRNERDPKQQVGEVLPKFYLIYSLFVINTHITLSLSLFSLQYLLYRLCK